MLRVGFKDEWGFVYSCAVHRALSTYIVCYGWVGRTNFWGVGE